MTKVILILLAALVLEAVGVVFLSAGLKEIGEMKSVSAMEIGRIIKRGVANSKILIGVLLETIFFICLLVLLKQNDVSLIWPLTSLGFVLTALSARFILHEQVTGTRWIGVALIVAGAALVSWSEKARKREPWHIPFHEPERRAPARLVHGQEVRAEQELGAPIAVHGPDARQKLEVEAPQEAPKE